MEMDDEGIDVKFKQLFEYIQHGKTKSIYRVQPRQFFLTTCNPLSVGYKASSEPPYASHTLVQIILHFIPKLSTQSILLKSYF